MRCHPLKAESPPDLHHHHHHRLSSFNLPPCGGAQRRQAADQWFAAVLQECDLRLGFSWSPSGNLTHSFPPRLHFLLQKQFETHFPATAGSIQLKKKPEVNWSGGAGHF